MACNSNDVSQLMAAPAGQDMSSQFPALQGFVSVPQTIFSAQMPVGTGVGCNFAQSSCHGPTMQSNFGKSFILPDKNEAKSIMSQPGQQSFQTSSCHDFTPGYQISQTSYEQRVHGNDPGETSFHSDSNVSHYDSANFAGSGSSDSFDSLDGTGDYETWKNSSGHVMGTANANLQAASPRHDHSQYSFESADAANPGLHAGSSHNLNGSTTDLSLGPQNDSNDMGSATVNPNVVLTQLQFTQNAGSGFMGLRGETFENRMPLNPTPTIHRNSTPSQSQVRPGNPMANGNADVAMGYRSSGSSSTTNSFAENANGHELLADSLHLSEQTLGDINSSLAHHASNNSQNISDFALTQTEENHESQSQVDDDGHGLKLSAFLGNNDISPGSASRNSDSERKLPTSGDWDQQIDDGLAERDPLYRDATLEALGRTTEGPPTETEFSSLDDAREKMKGKFQIPEEDATLPTTDTQNRAIVKVLVKLWVDTSCAKDNPPYIAGFQARSKDLKEIELYCWEILEATIRYTKEGPLINKKNSKKQRGNIGSFACRMAAVIETVHCHKSICEGVARPSLCHRLVQDPLGEQKRCMDNQSVNKRKAESLKLGNEEKKRQNMGHISSFSAFEQHSRPADNGTVKLQRRMKLHRTQNNPSGSPVPRRRRGTVGGDLQVERQLRKQEAEAPYYDISNPQQQTNVDRVAQSNEAGMRRYSTPVPGMANPYATARPDDAVSQAPAGYINAGGYSAPQPPTTSVNGAQQLVHKFDTSGGVTLPSCVVDDSGNIQQAAYPTPQHDQMAQATSDNNGYNQPQQSTHQPTGIPPLWVQYYEQMDMLPNQYQPQSPPQSTPAMNSAMNTPQHLQQASNPRRDLNVLKRHHSGP
ncbi:uncharacterized protein BDV17DRAFT_225332 [Aspergillus undulatus]|uniref:uncharacterized protein n=1 Tax=Aspergillus undulatus TaxID=1810928 RepID=UPI003CCD8F5F